MSPTHKDHKCMDANGRIFISKEVMFNETQLPYPLLFPTSFEKSTTSTSFSANIPLSCCPNLTPLFLFESPSPHLSSPDSPLS